MNIFLQELKAYRKSLTIWIIGVLVMVFSGMSKYAGMEGAGQSLNELMNNMPGVLKAMLGIQSLDVSSPLGFYGVLFTYLVIMLTVHAVMIGSTILSKEERDKTAEFLMTKPVTRPFIITSKLFAAAVQVTILTIVSFVSSLAAVYYFAGEGEFFREILIFSLGLWMLQVLFLTIGSGIAAMKKNPKKAPALSAAILLFTFFISIMADMTENLQPLKYITPFQYVTADMVINGNGIDGIYIFLTCILVSVFIWVTYDRYRKRDLYV
ncbi:MAG: ABC transporter permease subunit [Bacillaceae bacterium]|nr:ABC transporter permease subunit [Bacillaceae bacterium]